MLGRPSRPPVLKSVLLVDDNDRYARAITEDLEGRGAAVTRARTAAAGRRLITRGCGFDGIVTDITMETQISGLGVLLKARTAGFRGVLATASTGLDSGFGWIFNRLFLGSLMGCRYLIPKRLIRERGTVAWILVGRSLAGRSGQD